MPVFSKQSLQLLKNKIDLIEVLSSHVKWHRSGTGYKALCPFHNESTPSFIVQKGDTHYHCFGCGAHGDAISFLMTHMKMSFTDAVEHLAEKFHVPLEEVQGVDRTKGTSKTQLKEAMERAAQFYQFYLLHTPEGHAALDYLYHRGIDLDFIQTFGIGLAPKSGSLFLQVMQEQQISKALLEEVGLLSKERIFFSDRIIFPICDVLGSVIGFSARLYKIGGFGGKYINSPETPLFKKSKVLFGLSFARKTILKEKKALIVEGQIDALRLIHLGFTGTVAGQGTAFGEEMVKELIQMGVKEVYLSFDGDGAGREATVKVGHLFQKEAIEVRVVRLPEKTDPDLILQEKGPQAWQRLMDESVDYLTFLVDHFSQSINIQSPAGKNELVERIAAKIREWDHPLMIHESLRKLARLTNTPDAILGALQEVIPQTYIQRSSRVTLTGIDPHRILEADLLRWLLLMGEALPELTQIAEKNLNPSHFRTPVGRLIYQKYLEAVKENKPRDLLSLATELETEEASQFFNEILQKKVNREKALPLFIETVQKILEREWMHQREAIQLKIYSGGCNEAEVLALARQFDILKKERPVVCT